MRPLILALLWAAAFCPAALGQVERCVGTLLPFDSIYGLATSPDGSSDRAYLTQDVTTSSVKRVDSGASSTLVSGGYLNPKGVSWGNYLFVASPANCVVLRYDVNADGTLGNSATFGQPFTCTGNDGPKDTILELGQITRPAATFNKPTHVCTSLGAGPVAFVIDSGSSKIRRIGPAIILPFNLEVTTTGSVVGTPTACVYVDATKELYYASTSSATTHPTLYKLTMAFLGPSVSSSATIGTILLPGLDAVLTGPVIQWLNDDSSNSDSLLAVVGFNGNKNSVIVSVSKSNAVPTILVGKTTVGTRSEDGYQAVSTDLRAVKSVVRRPATGELLFADASTNSLRSIGARFCSQLVCEDCLSRTVSLGSAGANVKVIRNLSLLVTVSSWNAPSGVQVPCLYPSLYNPQPIGTVTTPAQEMGMNGYRFGVGWQKQITVPNGPVLNRGAFIPCRNISVTVEGGGITSFPTCQKRARVNCSLALDLDAGEWTAIGYTVAPNSSARIDVGAILPKTTSTTGLDGVLGKYELIAQQDGGVKPGLTQLPSLIISSAVISSYQLTDSTNATGASVAILQLVGQGFGPLLATSLEAPVITLISNSLVCTVASVTSTAITARCPVTPAYWRESSFPGFLLFLHYGVNFNAQVAALPPVRFATFTAGTYGMPRWGERIVFSGSAFAAGLTRIELVPSASAIAAAGAGCAFCPYEVPCLRLEYLSDKEVACTLRLVHDALLGSDNTGLQLKFTWAAVTGSNTLTSRLVPSGSVLSLNASADSAPFRVLWQAPASIQLPAQFLDRLGGQSVSISLPYPRMAPQDFTSISGALAAVLSTSLLDTVSGTIGGLPCPRCGYVDSLTVVCTTPASFLPQAKLVLRMSSSLNVTHDGLSPAATLIPPPVSSNGFIAAPSPAPLPAEAVPWRPPYLAYEAPLIVSISPSTVLIPPATLSSAVRPGFASSNFLNFTLDSVELHLAVRRGDISSLLIGNAVASPLIEMPDGRSVMAIQVTRSLIVNTAKNTLGAGGVSGSRNDPFVAAKITMSWAGQSISSGSPSIRCILRPSLFSLAPQRISGGKVVTLFGNDICPVLACNPANAANEISVMIGGSPCTNIVGAGPTLVTCTAPDLDQRTTPGFPLPQVTITNAAGGTSTDAVSAVYPARLAVAWSLETRALFGPGDSSSFFSVVPAAFAPSAWAGEENPSLPVLPTPTLQIFGNTSATCSIRAMPPSSTSLTLCEPLTASSLFAAIANGTATVDDLFGVALKPPSSSSSSSSQSEATTRAVVATGADLALAVTISGDEGFIAVPTKKMGLSAPQGCQVEIRAICSDALQERTEQSGPLVVQTPRLLGNWSSSTYSAISASQTMGVLPSADIAALVSAKLSWSPAWPPQAVLANGTIDDAATAAAAATASSRFSASIASFLLCNARLAPSSFANNFAAAFALSGVPATQSFSVATGTVSAVPPSYAQIAFPSLSLSRVKLGADVSVFADCSWLSSSERLIFPPLRFSLLSASVAFLNFSSNASAQVVVLPFQALPVPAKVSVSGMPTASSNAFSDASGVCSWRSVSTPSSSSSASPTLRLSGATATATYTVLSDGTLDPSPSVTVEGAFGDLPLDLVLRCSLWQRDVDSPALRIAASLLRLSFLATDGSPLAEDTGGGTSGSSVPSFLPQFFLPSDRSSESPLTPSLSVSLFDGAGSRVIGVTCSLSASPADVAVRAFAKDSQFSVQASDSPLNDGVVRIGRVVLVTGFNTPVVRLTLTCSRQSAQDRVQHSWEVRALTLAAAICSPPASSADSQAQLPPWSVSVGLLPVDAVVLTNETSASPASLNRGASVDASGRVMQQAQWPYLPPSLGPLASTAYSSWLCGQSPVAPSPALSSALSRGDIRCTAEPALAPAAVTSVVAPGSNSADKSFLSEASAIVDRNGIASFPSMSLAGQQNMTYSLQVVCRLGSTIDIPVLLPFSLRIKGCPVGSVPDGFLCRVCPENSFSLGNSDRICRGCPKGGAVCTEGRLQLLTDYWRAPSETGQPIGPSSSLFACPIPGACLLDASNLAAPSFSCSPGYSGALCGACDAPNYAFFGEACGPCWSPAATTALLAILVVLVASAVFFAAWRSGNEAAENKDSAILLRILLTYLQALGSLRAFRLGSGQVFRDYFNWSSAVAVSPFSLGPVQCALQFSFLSRFVSVALLPFLAALAVMAAYLTLSFGRALSASLASRSKRDGASLSPSSSSGASSANQGLLYRWSVDLTAWWGLRKPLAIVLSLGSLAFMPVISQCIAALDCLPFEVDGVNYLRSDMTVACGQGSHVVARVLAIVLLVVVGAGFPLIVIGALWKANEETTRSPAFRAVWLPLYHGYRPSLEQKPASGSSPASASATSKNPHSVSTATGVGGASKIVTAVRRRTQVFLELAKSTTMAQRGEGNNNETAACIEKARPASMLWFEGFVLIRKLGIVLLATLVADAYIQIVGFQLLILLCFLAHLYARPFVRSLFNVLEGLALLATLLTAIVASLLLQTTADLATSGQQGQELRTRSAAVAMVLIVGNGALLSVIALFYLHALLEACCNSRTAAQMATRSKIVAKITTTSTKILAGSPRQLPPLPSQGMFSGNDKESKAGLAAGPPALPFRPGGHAKGYLFAASTPSDDRWDGIDEDGGNAGRLEPVVNPLALMPSSHAASLGAGGGRSGPSSRQSFSAVRIGLQGRAGGIKPKINEPNGAAAVADTSAY